MKSIWFEDIVDVMLNIADPNTWWAISSVPWVSAPKINWATSIYNVEAEWWSWIAWWSTNVNWYASDYDTVTRWSGSVYLPDWTSLTISSGSTGNMSWVTYIYYDRDLWSVQTTTSAQASVWENKILLCVASPTSSGKDAEFQAFGTNKQSTFITADNIAANTITGNEIAANSIKAAQIDSDAITTSKIDAWAVTASKITVTQLSDIDDNLWSITAWSITWTTITAWNTNSTAIKLNPSTQSIQIYYNWSIVWEITWWSAGGYWAIWLNADYVCLLGRDHLDLSLAKLRVPVWTDLYD